MSDALPISHPMINVVLLPKFKMKLRLLRTDFQYARHWLLGQEVYLVPIPLLLEAGMLRAPTESGPDPKVRFKGSHDVIVPRMLPLFDGVTPRRITNADHDVPKVQLAGTTYSFCLDWLSLHPVEPVGPAYVPNDGLRRLRLG